MAAKQQSAKLDLRDRQREEREVLKKSLPRQFPSFKSWLNSENDLELSARYRYPGQLVLFAAQDNENFTTGRKGGNFDLRDYFTVLGSKRGGVMYCRKGKAVADFIDYGKKIVLSKKFDEAGVLSALQLASQKWGAVQLTGSAEYKRLCVRLAAKNNIRIANPELRIEIEAAQKSGMIEIKPELGQRVTFHVRGSKTTLTGEVLGIDNEKGTVTLQAGRVIVSVIADTGFFTEVDLKHTREYAEKLARKYVGEKGFVFSARSEGTYRGPIVKTTPTFAIQKTSPDMVTLHRLKDLEGFDETLVSKDREVIIRKVTGRATISIEQQRDEKDRNSGWSR
jgi:hypothetical protein